MYDSVTILRKKPVSTGVIRSEAAVNAARKSGAEVIAEKKVQHVLFPTFYIEVL